MAIQGWNLCCYGGLMGEGILGPMGVDLSVWWWSLEIPDALAVDREVFMVLIFCSIKPLDLG